MRVRSGDANRSAHGTAHPGQRLNQLALAVAVDTRDPDDLALGDFEVDAIERAPSVALDHQIFYFEQLLCLERVLAFERDRAGGTGRARTLRPRSELANHQCRQRVLSDLTAQRARHDAAATEHGDAVG